MIYHHESAKIEETLFIQATNLKMMENPEMMKVYTTTMVVKPTIVW